VLAGSIDYAGLFPPASLTMDAAVRAFAEYTISDDAWALGRFVLPASRLDEFVSAARRVSDGDAKGPVCWRLSALVGGLPADIERVRVHNEQFADTWPVEAVEVKAGHVGDVEMLGMLPSDLERYVEIPVAGELGAMLAAVRAIGACAKVRTGGVTPGAFPDPDDILRFMKVCRDAGVSFKATAGLHHPLRGEYPLTYEPASRVGTMFGYLNIVLAAAFLLDGAGDDVVRGVLTEGDAEALEFRDDLVHWRDHALPRAALELARGAFIRGVGSCSVREPLDELSALGFH
jgi:hypothetical protein